MKRFLTLATTAALVLGSTNAVAFGSTFADINTVPWPGAATFIDEAASLGLMSGYTENGKNAKNKVALPKAASPYKTVLFPFSFSFYQNAIGLRHQLNQMYYIKQ